MHVWLQYVVGGTDGGAILADFLNISFSQIYSITHSRRLNLLRDTLYANSLRSEHHLFVSDSRATPCRCVINTRFINLHPASARRLAGESSTRYSTNENIPHRRDTRIASLTPANTSLWSMDVAKSDYSFATIRKCMQILGV